MKIEVIRFEEDDKQTLGKFIVFDDYNCELAQGFTLELPDRNNQTSISRINPGEYTCERRYSSKYGHHFHVLDVEGRDYILIHHGNYYTNTSGCILVGDSITDINSDGHRDVTSSKKTMSLLNDLLPNRRFQLVIS